MMAAYNSEMNRRLYDAARAVAGCGAARGPRRLVRLHHGTLCHLVWGDRQWMSRFAGWEPPPPGTGAARTHRGLGCVARRPRRGGCRIEAWVGGLTPEWLAGTLVWFSGGSSKEMSSASAAVTLTHFFNHQTHHRGQAHALITQAGIRPADTDLPWIIDLEGRLGIGPGPSARWPQRPQGREVWMGPPVRTQRKRSRPTSASSGASSAR